MNTTVPVLLALGVLVTGSSLTGQGTTWIVDAAGGPGVHFTDIPPAVAAAADGDTILVRPITGSSGYSGFSTGKALTMLGDGGRAWVEGTIQVTGLAAGKTFVGGSLSYGPQIFGSPDVGAMTLAGNQGRIHLEDISGAGICTISSCSLVTMAGSVLGTPFFVLGSGFSPSTPLVVTNSTVSLNSVRVLGADSLSAPGPPICSPCTLAMSLGGSEVYLSRCEVRGGNGCSRLLAMNPQPCAAIAMTGGRLVITGDDQTRVVAGTPGGFGAAPTPAIGTVGGTVELDTAVTVTGSAGGPAVSGTAAVVQRRIVSLTGSGDAPGGMLTAELVSAPGDIYFLVAAVPADPVSLSPLGTVFIDPSVLLRLGFGPQPAAGRSSFSVRIPALPALRGGVIALQAANFYQSNMTLELSNPVVAVIN